MLPFGHTQVEIARQNNGSVVKATVILLQCFRMNTQRFVCQRNKTRIQVN